MLRWNAKLTKDWAARLPAPATTRSHRRRSVSTSPTLRELFTPFYRMRTLVRWSVWGLSFFVTQALSAWLPTIYRQELHLAVQQSLEFTLATRRHMTILSAIAVALAIDYPAVP